MENKEPNNPSTSGGVNIEELNSGLQQTFIHIDLKKTFFTITPSELMILEEGSSNIWKDVTLTSIGLGIPTILNSIIELCKISPIVFNAEIFINSLVGCICIIFSLVGGFLWRKNKNHCNELINELKGRPQYKV